MQVLTTTLRKAALVSAISCVTACTTVSLPPIVPISSPQAGAIVPLPPYKVQVGDVLDIKLFLNPELNEEISVRPDGMISTTLAEDVPAYNRTAAEIAADLRQRYAGTLPKAQLNVIVRSFAPNRIYVAGEVNTPGEFITIGPNLTVVQAIARAGGVKLSADRNRVFVLRRGPHDVPQAFAVNYMDAISGADPTADARLAQYDIVYVPRTGIYEAFSYFNQYIQQFAPISWGFTYNLNPIVGK